MNKKRILIFSIPLVLIILAGGYLLLDKLYFHRIFKINPGSCLILEEKYCKTAALKFNNNNSLVGITFKVKQGAHLFSPISDNYSITNLKKDNGTVLKVVVFGNQRFDGQNKNNRDLYLIVFDGELIGSYDKTSLDNKIKKGDLFNIVPKNPKTTDILIAIQTASYNESGVFDRVSDADEIQKIFNSIKK